MNTPTGREGDRHWRSATGVRRDRRTLSTCLECLVGGITAALAFLFSLPTLVDLTRPLGLQSTTALAFLFLFTWIVLWATIGVTREHVRAA